MALKMKKMFVESTNKTPQIDLDPENGVLQIKGVSIPEDANRIYTPVVEWAERYVRHTELFLTVVRIKIIYFNTSTSDYLMNFLKTFKKLGEKVRYEWYFETDDDDMKETGIHFESILEVKFHYIEVEEI
ncbi:MAG: DUF1987 domain-containing protein [Bacteroidetes bacterium]|nr:MAG: DUF1987 domain-containing protein [Bacteroidota bacterium]TAG86505.1 MAG: DUF1987 domain-containing protein [Bacteroidota bacterium]